MKPFMVNSSPLKQSLGSALRKTRQEKGLSLADVAEGTGRSKGNLSQLETKGSGLTIDALFEICDVLGVIPATVIRRASNDGGATPNNIPSRKT